ncbi:helicase HerA domain-containing protein [Pseudofrankia sp. BMG5.37]|uniref:helicase HerA domain-containing protein n=1 Tax=Pseudofrankia sp. BMG5.37 TaxID=3050035 RepID=UPI002893F583|nr:DUF87 domain-containing protein [Pseudofrankia sp. BMG5.37]MDT3440944.1 DUF87 domain-containing protein [Pseudofrankia sp. BMG5.37]
MPAPTERDAFAALNLNWIRTADGVWTPSPVHVDGLHADTVRSLLDAIRDAAASPEDNPPGLVVQGQAGAGKTHLLGWVREQVHEAGGYFFLVGPLGGAAPFWESVIGAIVDGLTRPAEGGQTQLRLFLRRLADVVGASPSIVGAVTGRIPLEPVHLKDFVVALRSYDRRLGGDCQDTLRALVLFGSDDLDDEDVGRGYLQSMEEQFPNERAERGMRSPAKPATEIVRELSRLLAITGPTVIAVDQIDTATAETHLPHDHPDPADAPNDDAPGPRGPGGPGSQGGQGALSGQGGPGGPWVSPIVNEVADGLLGLRDLTTRTLCLLACLPITWDLVATQAVRSVRDRFRVVSPLGVIGAGELAEQLVARRFDQRYRTIGFTPPYPTWPVRPEALLTAGDYTPRALLQRIDAHVRACLASGTHTELRSFDDVAVEDAIGVPVLGAAPTAGARAAGGGPISVGGGTIMVNGAAEEEEFDLDGPAGRRLVVGFAELDVAWARLRAGAPGLEALADRDEDDAVPDLLAAGLDAWIAELGPAGRAFSRDARPSAKPALHARLRRVLDETTGDEAHWSFRAILTTHPGTALTRLNNACTMAGIATGIGAGEGGRIRRRDRGLAGLDGAAAAGRRALVVLRSAEWSKGVKTQDALEAFERAGGITHFLSDEDLRTFAALRQLLDGRHPTLQTWLLARRPASSTPLLTAALDAVYRELAPEPGHYPPVVAAPATPPAPNPFVVMTAQPPRRTPFAPVPAPVPTTLVLASLPRTADAAATHPRPAVSPAQGSAPARVQAPAPTTVTPSALPVTSSAPLAPRSPAVPVPVPVSTPTPTRDPARPPSPWAPLPPPAARRAESSEPAVASPEPPTAPPVPSVPAPAPLPPALPDPPAPSTAPAVAGAELTPPVPPVTPVRPMLSAWSASAEPPTAVLAPLAPLAPPAPAPPPPALAPSSPSTAPTAELVPLAPSGPAVPATPPVLPAFSPPLAPAASMTWPDPLTTPLAPVDPPVPVAPANPPTVHVAAAPQAWTAPAPLGAPSSRPVRPGETSPAEPGQPTPAGPEAPRSAAPRPETARPETARPETAGPESAEPAEAAGWPRASRPSSPRTPWGAGPDDDVHDVTSSPLLVPVFVPGAPARSQPAPPPPATTADTAPDAPLLVPVALPGMPAAATHSGNADPPPVPPPPATAASPNGAHASPAAANAQSPAAFDPVTSPAGVALLVPVTSPGAGVPKAPVDPAPSPAPPEVSLRSPLPSPAAPAPAQMPQLVPVTLTLTAGGDGSAGHDERATLRADAARLPPVAAPAALQPLAPALPAPAVPAPAKPAPAVPARAVPTQAVPAQAVEEPGELVTLGAAAGTRAAVELRLAALRRHTVVFAGSGSGKTVLVRRLVEECALRGVSSVVLDPAGELARLGDAWPSPPGHGRSRGDAELAREYLAATDVVVWTPNLDDGRPLRLTAGGDGPATDPGELLTPAPGRRARVSVVSLMGLPTVEGRQAFVSELQRALLAWTGGRPAAGRPLAGLLVLDEAQTFAPAGQATPYTDSTLALLDQAGDHGLGLVFATQSPKGLDPRVSAGAATHFLGRLNVPVQIDAARALATALGGEAPEIGRLGVGEFYAASAGLPIQRVNTPLCLTHHPGWPLPLADVLARARRR